MKRLESKLSGYQACSGLPMYKVQAEQQREGLGVQADLVTSMEKNGFKQQVHGIEVAEPMELRSRTAPHRRISSQNWSKHQHKGQMDITREKRYRHRLMIDSQKNRMIYSVRPFAVLDII